MQLATFQFNNHPLTVVGSIEEPWFVGREVCAALGIKKPENSLALLHDDERGTHSVGTPGGPQSMTTVSESGLYALIFKSRRPEAQTFRRWVTHEVLPSIRRTGAYATTAKRLADLDAFIADCEAAGATEATLLNFRAYRMAAEHGAKPTKMPVVRLGRAKAAKGVAARPIPIDPDDAKVDAFLVELGESTPVPVWRQAADLYREFAEQCDEPVPSVTKFGRRARAAVPKRKTRDGNLYLVGGAK